MVSYYADLSCWAPYDLKLLRFQSGFMHSHQDTNMFTCKLQWKTDKWKKNSHDNFTNKKIICNAVDADFVLYSESNNLYEIFDKTMGMAKC